MGKYRMKSPLGLRWYTISRGQSDEIAAARKWLQNFTIDNIPKQIFDISFCRSSGPGGQNVNKVNTKATLRVSLNQLYPFIPKPLHPHLQESRYYAKNSHCLTVHADENRRQTDNVELCRKKLSQLILDIARKAIPNETSQVKVSRIDNALKAANEMRLKSKNLESGKKASRRATFFDD